MPRGRNVPEPAQEAPEGAALVDAQEAESTSPQPPVPRIFINLFALTLDDLPFIHRLRRFYSGETSEDAAITDMEIIEVLDRAVVGGKKAVPLTRYREAI